MTSDNPDLIATAAALIGFTRTLNSRLRDAPGAGGLALADLNVLAGIDKGYDLSTTLVRRLMLDAPRVSRIVEGFVGGGYLAREPDPDDRRRCRLRLTPQGSARLAQGRAELARAMDDLMCGLTPQERAGLESAVPGMARVLQSNAVEAAPAVRPRRTTALLER